MNLCILNLCCCGEPKWIVNLGVVVCTRAFWTVYYCGLSCVKLVEWYVDILSVLWNLWTVC